MPASGVEEAAQRTRRTAHLHIKLSLAAAVRSPQLITSPMTLVYSLTPERLPSTAYSNNNSFMPRRTGLAALYGLLLRLFALACFVIGVAFVAFGCVLENPPKQLVSGSALPWKPCRFPCFCQSSNPGGAE